jgi:RNA polymerase sigma-70 factor (ECF subfamily)
MLYFPVRPGCGVDAAAQTRSQEAEEHEPAPATKDEELLLQYAEQDNRGAFDELVRRYERKIYSFLRNYLGDEQLAEDAFQATFLQVHLKCRQFDGSRRLQPWLYRIAANQATDLLRRNRRHKAYSLDGPWSGDGGSEEGATPLDFLEDDLARRPGERLESAEDRQRIGSALETLPERLKQTLILVIYQGLKYREAAEVLGVPVGTVKSRMHDAVRTLHEALITAAHTATNKTKAKLMLQEVLS